MSARLSAVASSLVVLGGLAFAAPAWSQAAGGTVTVHSKAGYAHLRAEPTTHSEVLDKINEGTKLEVVGKSGAWTQVKSGDKTGYINNHLLRH
ncbi:MAG TPA: SH3 domain-containing protein [Candidatus Sulfotelmatobacter sp.]|nr:SH3 domain-containing protein [Candidatus Sulfotelmatobacter sp.]